MTVRKEERDGRSLWIIDIRYKTVDGRKHRFRHDAQVQTRSGAEQQHRHLLVELARRGTLEETVQQPTEAPSSCTFEEVVRLYRATHAQTSLKPSTRKSYDAILDRLLLPRLGQGQVATLGGTAIVALDVELVSDKLSASTRRNVHIVFRSILHFALDSGLLEEMPKLPSLPRVGRKEPVKLRAADAQAILSTASHSARLACALAAFAGLRAGEVRGLRWTDIDLNQGTLAVRRTISRGEESTPKSHHERPIPISMQLRTLLELHAVERAAEIKKNPWSLVTVTKHGNQWGEFGLNQAFQRAAARAGREGLSFHALRHSSSRSWHGGARRRPCCARWPDTPT